MIVATAPIRFRSETNVRAFRAAHRAKCPTYLKDRSIPLDISVRRVRETAIVAVVNAVVRCARILTS